MPLKWTRNRIERRVASCRSSVPFSTPCIRAVRLPPRSSGRDPVLGVRRGWRRHGVGVEVEVEISSGTLSSGTLSSGTLSSRMALASRSTVLPSSASGRLTRIPSPIFQEVESLYCRKRNPCIPRESLNFSGTRPLECNPSIPRESLNFWGTRSRECNGEHVLGSRNTGIFWGVPEKYP